MKHAQTTGNNSCVTNLDALAIQEAQFILAEKRTSLAVMRSGIAVFALPLTVLSFLIATSRYYVISDVLGFLIPVIITCSLLAVFGAYLVIRSGIKIRRLERILEELKKKHSLLSDLSD